MGCNLVNRSSYWSWFRLDPGEGSAASNQVTKQVPLDLWALLKSYSFFKAMDEYFYQKPVIQKKPQIQKMDPKFLAKVGRGLLAFGISACTAYYFANRSQLASSCKVEPPIQDSQIVLESQKGRVYLPKDLQVMRLDPRAPDDSIGENDLKSSVSQMHTELSLFSWLAEFSMKDRFIQSNQSGLKRSIGILQPNFPPILLIQRIADDRIFTEQDLLKISPQNELTSFENQTTTEVLRPLEVNRLEFTDLSQITERVALSHQVLSYTCYAILPIFCFILLKSQGASTQLRPLTAHETRIAFIDKERVSLTTKAENRFSALEQVKRSLLEVDERMERGELLKQTPCKISSRKGGKSQSRNTLMGTEESAPRALKTPRQIHWVHSLPPDLQKKLSWSIIQEHLQREEIASDHNEGLSKLVKQFLGKPK